ncbi:hypothetical protein BJV77DRAFT_1159400 [Russula vinacea]|nr:hypothetical protein BJV77DRAFT_1159400 [Russula vinacea]
MATWFHRIFTSLAPSSPVPLRTARSLFSLSKMMVSGVRSLRTCLKPILSGATPCPGHWQLKLVHYWQCPAQVAPAWHQWRRTCWRAMPTGYMMSRGHQTLDFGVCTSLPCRRNNPSNQNFSSAPL